MSFDVAMARLTDIRAQLGLVDARSDGSTASATGSTVAPFAQQLGQAIGAGASGNSSADPTQYDDLLRSAAARYGVDPSLLRAVVKNESGFAAGATSSAGAQGLMQLMPGTAAGLGVTDPLDPAQSIDGGTRYLKAQLDRFGGDVTKAVAAYNAGPNAVARYDGVPPYAETQAYVRRVLADAAAAPLSAAPAAPATTDTTTGRTAW
jgi:soluble lytic murein transglycosylase-like protein